MNFKYLSFGGGLAASLTLPASAETGPHAPAVKACTAANAYQPVIFIAAVDDGRGGSLVWLTDADANLWLCNADNEGHVFAYSKMVGDLLEGAGASLVDIDPVTNETGMPKPDPLKGAGRACQAYLADGPGKIVGGGPDGLDGNWVPGFYVFIETSEGLFLCDATGDAQVWVFAEIGDPLSFGNPVG
jgi:hypothetical protein